MSALLELGLRVEVAHVVVQRELHVHVHDDAAREHEGEVGDARSHPRPRPACGTGCPRRSPRAGARPPPSARPTDRGALLLDSASRRPCVVWLSSAIPSRCWRSTPVNVSSLAPRWDSNSMRRSVTRPSSTFMASSRASIRTRLPSSSTAERSRSPSISARFVSRSCWPPPHRSARRRPGPLHGRSTPDRRCLRRSGG